MRFLIADDSFDWLKIHSAMLTEIFGENIELITACSATEALELYKSEYQEQPFDLVITDLQMEQDYEPSYAGEWLINEINQLESSQKILIVSSCFNVDQIAQNYNVDYLSKRLLISDKDSYALKLSELFIEEKFD